MKCSKRLKIDNMSGKKIALVVGVSGQDGIYCTKLLLSEGYKVIGTTRCKKNALEKIPLLKNLCIEIVEWDLVCFKEIKSIIRKYEFLEIYNFAAMSKGGDALFEDSIMMAEVNALAVVKILEAIREINPKIKFCQASSSEMFSRQGSIFVNESSPLEGRNPYAASKILAHSNVAIYRNYYGLYACSAILFNHESPLRSVDFVSRKISSTVAKIKLGLEKNLILGNLDSKRDWMYAGDAVKAIKMILNQKIPEDYVVSSGSLHSIREFCDIAFSYVNLNYKDFTRVSENLSRRIDSEAISGENSKLMSIGWKPSLTFIDLVEKMVESDLIFFNQKISQ